MGEVEVVLNIFVRVIIRTFFWEIGVNGYRCLRNIMLILLTMMRFQNRRG
jgi:cellobiose-specific phosphotransferase system component IIC